MKMRVSITINVNEEAWAYEYGLDKADVRADVRQALENLVRESYSGSFFTEVTTK